MPRTATVLFIAIITLAGNVAGLPSGERIVQLLDSSNYEALAKELRQSADREPETFSAGGYSYLLARVEEKRGDYASAAQQYHASSVQDPALKSYALKHLAQIMRFSGNLVFERLFLTEIAYRESAVELNDAALQRLVRNFYESGDYPRVIEIIEKGTAAASNTAPVNSDARELSLLLGISYFENKMPEQARSVFRELLDSDANPDQPDDFALEAVKGLDRLEVGESSFGIKVANLTVPEHSKRAGIYQFNRNFALARLHYNSIVDNHTGNREIPVSMLQIARGYDQERDYRKALEWYQKILDQFPDSDLNASALYGTAGAYANLDDTENTVAAYKKYIEENPKAKNLERAHLNIVDAYRDSGDNAKALEWSQNIQSLFPGGMGEAVALFCDARIYISEEKWDQAYSSLRRLDGLQNLGGGIAGGSNKNEIEFLTAFTLEKMGRIAEAVDVYLAIRDGRGEYYGWRSTERLGRLSSVPKNKTVFQAKIEALERGKSKLDPDALRRSEQDILRLKQSASIEPVTRAYQGIEEYWPVPTFESKPPLVLGAAKKLLEIGLYDEAAPAMEIELRARMNISGDDLSDFDDTTAFSLAEYYVKGGFADRAIRFIEPKWKKIPRDFQIGLIPDDQAAILYPAPFRYELLKYGKKEKVDPRFLLALMRQESRFQANIKSAAAARGLMQFISGTSRKIAIDLDFAPYSNDRLYDPETAIRFGSRYLANLFKDFPGQYQSVAASYNAGEDRVERWMKRAKTDDPDRYVAEIVFRQTKDYVYSVMANYRMYQYLYDENLVRNRKDGDG